MLRNMNILELPIEIILIIISYLDAKDIIPLFFVSKAISEISQNDQVWKAKYKNCNLPFFEKLTKRIADSNWKKTYETTELVPNLKFIMDYLNLYRVREKEREFELGRHNPIRFFYSITSSASWNVTSEISSILKVVKSQIEWIRVIYLLRKKAAEYQTSNRESLLAETFNALCNYIINALSKNRKYQKYIEDLKNQLKWEVEFQNKRRNNGRDNSILDGLLDLHTMNLLELGDSETIQDVISTTSCHFNPAHIVKDFKTTTCKSVYNKNFMSITGLSFEDFFMDSIQTKFNVEEQSLPSKNYKDIQEEWIDAVVEAVFKK